MVEHLVAQMVLRRVPELKQRPRLQRRAATLHRRVLLAFEDLDRRSKPTRLRAVVRIQERDVGRCERCEGVVDLPVLGAKTRQTHLEGEATASHRVVFAERVRLLQRLIRRVLLVFDEHTDVDLAAEVLM